MYTKDPNQTENKTSRYYLLKEIFRCKAQLTFNERVVSRHTLHRDGFYLLLTKNTGFVSSDKVTKLFKESAAYLNTDMSKRDVFIRGFIDFLKLEEVTVDHPRIQKELEQVLKDVERWVV